jgi:hypothetical protein
LHTRIYNSGFLWTNRRSNHRHQQNKTKTTTTKQSSTRSLQVPTVTAIADTGTTADKKLQVGLFISIPSIDQ